MGSALHHPGPFRCLTPTSSCLWLFWAHKGEKRGEAESPEAQGLLKMGNPTSSMISVYCLGFFPSQDSPLFLE